MAKVLSDHWSTQDWAALGFASEPHIEWQGRGVNDHIPADEPYIIWAAKHSDAGQIGMSDTTRIYESVGMIVIQCKGPLIKGNGFEVAERMAIIARNAYRGKQTADCIWFRNAQFKEVGADGGWYLFNTYIEFEYNEVG